MIHLTIQQLSSFIDGELGEASAALAREHFAACPTCSAKFERLASQEKAVGQLLVCSPPESVFEGITGALAERIQSERRRTVPAQTTPSAPAPEPPASGAVRPTRSSPNVRDPAPPEPRERPASAPIEPASVRFMGAPTYSGLDDDEGAIRGRGRARATARENGTSFSWSAAFLILAIAGSTAALIFGSEFVSYWLGGTEPNTRLAQGPRDTGPAQAGPVPEAASTASPLVRASSRGLPEPDERTLEPSEPVWQSDSRDDFEPVPEQLPGDDTETSAVDFEAAATEWERSLPGLHGDDYLTARLRLAEARYRVWQIEPSKEHAARAVGAIRAYLVGAPPGSDRDRAARWLVEVEEARY